MKYFLILLLSAICFCQESAFTSETYNEINLRNKYESSVDFKFSVVPKAELEYFIGREKFSRFISENDTFDFNYGQLKTRVGLDFKYGSFTLYFDTDTYMNKSKKGFTFDPTHVDFFSGFSINIKENIKLSFVHLCQHPVTTYSANKKDSMYGGFSSIKISYNY